MRVLLTNSIANKGLAPTICNLKKNMSAIDSIENGIRLVESDPDAGWVGLGGDPNMLGIVELDATIMNGRTLHAGSVGALVGYSHPISVARQVMEQLPHVFLVGEGAARFAKEIGSETGDNLTEKSYQKWKAWFTQKISDVEMIKQTDIELINYTRLTTNPATAKGTTIFLAQDSNGDLSAGSSSSGWSYKYPGRLGDSAIIGAGCYADNRYGAAACTGMGELSMRTSTARSIILYLKMKMSIEEACIEAFNDLRALPKKFKGGLSIYAIDNKSNHFVLSVKKEDNDIPECDSYYWHWQEGSAAATKIDAHIVNW